MIVRRKMRLLTAEKAERERNTRERKNVDAILRAQQTYGQVLLAKLAKATRRRDVDRRLARDKNVARLIDRLKDLGLAVPTEIGYDVLLQRSRRA
jgi:tRNA A-37 threonylcarbamoyl transferase component Bud32